MHLRQLFLNKSRRLMAMVGIKTSSFVGHLRLGHPASKIISRVLKNSKLPCPEHHNFRVGLSHAKWPRIKKFSISFIYSYMYSSF